MSQQPNNPSWDSSKPRDPLADLPGPPVAVAAPPVITTPATAPTGPSRRWGFWATLGLTLIIFMGWLAPQAALAALWMTVNSTSGSRGLESNGLFFALAVCAGAPVSLGPGLPLCMGPRANPLKRVFGPASCAPQRSPPMGLVLLLLALCSDMLTMYLGRPIVPEFMVRAYESAGFAPLFWVAIVIVAPVSEEILFRGFLFEGIHHSRLGP